MRPVPGRRLPSIPGTTQDVSIFKNLTILGPQAGVDRAAMRLAGGGGQRGDRYRRDFWHTGTDELRLPHHGEQRDD